MKRNIPSRREVLITLACAPALGRAAGSPTSAWTAEWDRELVTGAVERLGAQFDGRENMLSRSVGGAYSYHSGVRETRVHPTRESLQYALLLLEAGGAEAAGRAGRIVERVIALQDTDPGSKWYGIWGYYMEEPPARMTPADWNWADFNGATLLMIEARHGARLPEGLRSAMRESIRHAAASVRRRNVTVNYTNIAVQGSFVVMAAAELLGDADLRAYAVERWGRFARNLDETGSFAEYNSPTYSRVTIENLTRMQMVVRDPDFLALARRVQHRAWLHLADHWHAPTRQLAGPMSRCYSTDLGGPLWLQKATRGRLAFVTLDRIRADRNLAEGDTGVTAYRCPEELVPRFLKLRGSRQHREAYLPAKPPALPVRGTTWLEPRFTLGSINRADFWIQRRPLLAYWGGEGRPAHYAQLRFVKDDYDFCSALYYGVQRRNCILGLVNFRNPGGDRHVSLDPIQNGEFHASRLRLRLDLAGVAAGAGVTVDGKPAAAGTAWPLPCRVGIDLGGLFLFFHLFDASFGAGRLAAGALSLAREDGLLVVSADLLRSSEPRLVRWSEVATAHLAFTLAVEGAKGSLARRLSKLGADAPRRTGGPAGAVLEWRSPAGLLRLTGNLGVGPVAEQDAAFRDG